MAAYAALLSLMQTIHHIQIHPRPPISFHKQQLHPLTQKLTFLKKFLERNSSSSSEEDVHLESRIAAAAYAAEDLIESHIVDHIHARSNTSAVDLCQCVRTVIDLIKNEVMKIMGAQIVHSGTLERVTRDMDLIEKEATEILIKEKIMGSQNHHRQHTNSFVTNSTWQSSTMVDFDDVLINDVLDKVIGQQQGLQIIPIVGMGGIGKTTFARNIYANPLIVEHFDILFWVTISREYSAAEILSQVLCQDYKSEMSEDELGERVHKMLWGRRYCIVMDDIWKIDVWDKIKLFFPDNNNGSRIMKTSRLSNLAFELSGPRVFQMQFLDEDKSWDLLHQIVFSKVVCPSELVNVGKEIARNCRGLPLSIVVIGGLLAKCNMTRAYWVYTLQNLNSLINLENDEYCLQILHTSYRELPVHLKPCFLYMGVYPEDFKINVSGLIKLWVAEGILRPIIGKSLEEVAKEYLKELIDRNLILIHELRWSGEAKLCKIHDLLRDLCLREARKQRFLCILRKWDRIIPQGINMERRICIHDNPVEEYSLEFFYALESAPLTRSLILMWGCHEPSPSLSFRLLRVYSKVLEHSIPVECLASVEEVFQKANLRYLTIDLDLPEFSRIPSSWLLFWNLQTLKVENPYSSKPIIAPSEIWEMSQLRHVMIERLELPDPPCVVNSFILKNLQTFLRIRNFNCSKGVIKRIPNIKTLKLEYVAMSLEKKRLLNLCLSNLVHLQKLESFSLRIRSDDIPDQEMFQSSLVQNISFPHFLKKLTLCGTMLSWEDLTTKVGSLPLLQVLKLYMLSCIGAEWETAEGIFCSLKFLLINDTCGHLREWRTESTTFHALST